MEQSAYLSIIKIFTKILAATTVPFPPETKKILPPSNRTYHVTNYLPHRFNNCTIKKIRFQSSLITIHTVNISIFVRLQNIIQQRIQIIDALQPAVAIDDQRVQILREVAFKKLRLDDRQLFDPDVQVRVHLILENRREQRDIRRVHDRIDDRVRQLRLD